MTARHEEVTRMLSYGLFGISTMDSWKVGTEDKPYRLQVTVAYWWFLVMEIFKSGGNILDLKSKQFRTVRENTIANCRLLAHEEDTLREVPLATSEKVANIPVLFPVDNHPGNTRLSVFNESKELDDIRVAKSTSDVDLAPERLYHAGLVLLKRRLKTSVH